MPALEFSRDARVQRARALEKCRELLRGEPVAQRGEIVLQLAGDLVGTVRVFFKGVHTLMIPPREDFALGAGHERHMDIDRGALADAVESADALFEQLGILREIEKHEVMRKLEVPSLAADLRAEQDARALVAGEECGIAIALKQREALMENAAVHLYRALDARGDFLDEFARAADEQDFFGAEVLQQLHKPFHLRRNFVPVAGERMQLRLAFWKSRERCARVAEHHAARAESIKQFAHEVRARGGVAFGKFVTVCEHARRLFSEKRAILRSERLSGEQTIQRACDFLVVRVFLQKLREVRVAVGIEQAQAREVPLRPELLRGRGEQQQALRFLREIVHERILPARALGAPLHVVRFVHDEQIPSRLGDLPCALRVRREHRDAAEHELAVEERVRIRLVQLDGRAALLVENAEHQIEPPQQLDEPLVHERLRDEHENALRAAREMQPVQDQPRLDRLAEADLVREQHARHEPSRDFTRDEHLVRQQIHAPADKTAHGRAPQIAAPTERLGAQFKRAQIIRVPAEEPVLGLAETDRVGEFRLGKFAA